MKDKYKFKLENKTKQDDKDEEFIDSKYVSLEDDSWLEELYYSVEEEMDTILSSTQMNDPLDDKLLDEFAEIEIIDKSIMELQKMAASIEGTWHKEQNESIEDRDSQFELLYKMKNLIKPKYNHYYWAPYTGEDFVKEATFLANYEDDYTYITPFYYFTGLRNMDLTQLRTYYTFRKNIRNQKYPYVPYNYLMLLLNEIVNFIGISSFTDGVELLIELWANYRETYRHLDNSMPSRIRSFYVCYSNQEKFEDIVKLFPIHIVYDAKEISEIRNSNYQGKLDFFNYHASYKIMKSGFYTDDKKQMLEGCFAYILTSLKPLFKTYKLDMNKILVSVSRKRNWNPFFEESYYFPTKYEYRLVKIEDAEIFEYMNGGWKKESYYAPIKNGFLGYTFKLMEIKIRQIVNHKHKISANPIKMLNGTFHGSKRSFELICSKEFMDTINLAIDEYYHSDLNSYQIGKIEKPKVIFDLKKFNKIREISDSLQEKLIVEDENITENISGNVDKYSRIEETATNKVTKDLYTDREKELLCMMMKQVTVQELNQYALEKESLLEVLMEEINEKSLEEIGDSIIDINEVGYIYPDYLDYVSEILKEDADE